MKGHCRHSILRWFRLTVFDLVDVAIFDVRGKCGLAAIILALRLGCMMIPMHFEQSRSSYIKRTYLAFELSGGIVDMICHVYLEISGLLSGVQTCPAA